MKLGSWLHRFSCCCLLFLPAVMVMAQGSGRIQGRILDQGGNPVSFANVIVEGTTIGASANADGNYTIMNVPAGTHAVIASGVGYRKERAADVTVTEGQTVTHDFTLQQDILGMKEVVVTGTITPRQKLESTIAISTLGPQEVAQAAPRSTTELLRYVPGFTRIESSGGEVNQNIGIRGIMGVEYVMFMEDGMPVFPTMHTFFMNADNLFRPDFNIASVEVVRGGSSALFGSNTPGAIINFINNSGGPQLTGLLGTTVGTKGLARYDFNVNGPLGDQWRFNSGGFYRYDRGIRYPGFPGIEGGQIKASVTRLLDSGYIRVSTKIIDDRNQFILPLPFRNPSDPDYVGGFSDYGAMNTLEGNYLRVPTPSGDLTLPLDNGLRTDAAWLTGDVAFNFADQWSVQNTAQIMRDAQQWNAILPFDLMTGGAYLNTLAFPAGVTGRLFYTNHFDATGKPLPVDTSMLISPGGEWHVEKPIAAFQDQLQIKKTVDKHTFSLGLYFANYTQINHWYFTDILMDVRNNPRFIDVVGFGPADTVHLTKNGFRNFMSNYVNGEGHTSIFSGSIGGALQLTDMLRMDIGARYEMDDYVQSSENTTTIDLDKDPATPYDKETWGSGSFRQFSKTLDDWAGSIGLNYKVTEEWAVYGQASRAYKMPALDEFLNAQAQAAIDLFQNQRTQFYEGGVKYASPQLGFSVNGFWGQLENIVSQGAEVDTTTGATVWVTRSNPKNRAYGLEVEASVSPVSGLTFLGAGTFLHPQTVESAGSALTAGGIPASIFNISGRYTISGVTAVADFHYVGTRDLINANYNQARGIYTTFDKIGELKAYNYMNFGLSYTLPGRGITIQANLLNAYQSKGLEEGNPRLPAKGGTPIFLARPILPTRFQLGLQYQF